MQRMARWCWIVDDSLVVCYTVGGGCSVMGKGIQVRKSLSLWKEEWDALGRIAEETNSVPPSGPSADSPSWRSLVKEIARGNIVVIRVREQEPVERELDGIVCPICGREVVRSGPGAQHLYAHVAAGEAVDLGGDIQDWTVRFVPS
jgi:hypothetical protein